MVVMTTLEVSKIHSLAPSYIDHRSLTFAIDDTSHRPGHETPVPTPWVPPGALQTAKKATPPQPPKQTPIQPPVIPASRSVSNIPVTSRLQGDLTRRHSTLRHSTSVNEPAAFAHEPQTQRKLLPKSTPVRITHY